ncbi:catechol 1,2-dioxygenase [Streptomyces acidiscabies]|uniref:DODA-type extradiol aromatic ring-opening family dioxygenase n=1 Tax=Streptomyces acidiscabies TaxID=42234 RepID=UPI0030D33D2D
MGEIVGAGLLAHVPLIMLPHEARLEENDGKEITLVTGLQALRREVFEVADYDTVVVMDSHWATTVEFVVTAHDRRAGLFTSDELPRGMCRIPYDWPGDPELAGELVRAGTEQDAWITGIDDPYLPTHYATVNLWHYLGRGLADKRWVSIGVCQTGEAEDHLRVGRALATAVERTNRKVLVIASGALSHAFWPLRQTPLHTAAAIEHIRTPQAARADLERIAWFQEGNHGKVLATMDEFRAFRPEAGFAHYLMLAGALGGAECTAAARQFGEYENALGTGQVHLWFDRPESGWTGRS